MQNRTITIRETQLIAAFSQWERNYRQHPERFQSEATKIQNVLPEDYAVACAKYIFAMLERADIAKQAEELAEKWDKSTSTPAEASASVL